MQHAVHHVARQAISIFLKMASDDEDDYIFFGTPIQEEEESRAGQRRKDVKDPALTKQLPLHKQVQHHSLQHL